MIKQALKNFFTKDKLSHKKLTKKDVIKFKEVFANSNENDRDPKFLSGNGDFIKYESIHDETLLLSVYILFRRNEVSIIISGLLFYDEIMGEWYKTNMVIEKNKKLFLDIIKERNEKNG